MFKAVLIDVDNTLLDFDAYVRETMREGFEKFGIAKYEDYMSEVFIRMNNAMWREIENGTMTFEQLLKNRWNTIFKALGIEGDGEKFEKYFRAALRNSAIHVEGAAEMLEYLSSRYTLAVAGNGPYEQQIHRLTLGGLDKYFSHFFLSEKIGYPKPAKEFFDHCLDVLQLDPSEVIMIGDTIASDMVGAVGSKIPACYFDRYGVGNNTELPIDFTIHSLSEIKNIL